MADLIARTGDSLTYPAEGHQPPPSQDVLLDFALETAIEEWERISRPGVEDDADGGEGVVGGTPIGGLVHQPEEEWDGLVLQGPRGPIRPLEDVPIPAGGGGSPGTVMEDGWM